MFEHVHIFHIQSFFHLSSLFSTVLNFNIFNCPIGCSLLPRRWSLCFRRLQELPLQALLALSALLERRGMGKCLLKYRSNAASLEYIYTMYIFLRECNVVCILYYIIIYIYDIIIILHNVHVRVQMLIEVKRLMPANPSFMKRTGQSSSFWELCACGGWTNANKT